MVKKEYVPGEDGDNMSDDDEDPLNEEDDKTFNGRSKSKGPAGAGK